MVDALEIWGGEGIQISGASPNLLASRDSLGQCAWVPLTILGVQKGPKPTILPGILGSLLTSSAYCGSMVGFVPTQPDVFPVCHTQIGSVTCWTIQMRFGSWLCKDAVPKCREEQGLTVARKLFLLPVSNSTRVYLGMMVKAVRGLLAVAMHSAREWHCSLSSPCSTLSELRVSAALCIWHVRY